MVSMRRRHRDSDVVILVKYIVDSRWGKGSKTYRTSDFDNKELESLPTKVKTKIENKCKDVLNILDY